MLGSEHGAGMNKMEALAERARLQKLLDSYDGSRLAQREEDERTEGARAGTPDRAGNVRARIARLDELISDIENDESS
jgi:hypothetical protein